MIVLNTFVFVGNGNKNVLCRLHCIWMCVKCCKTSTLLELAVLYERLQARNKQLLQKDLVTQGSIMLCLCKPSQRRGFQKHCNRLSDSVFCRLHTVLERGHIAEQTCRLASFVYFVG